MLSRKLFHRASFALACMVFTSPALAGIVPYSHSFDDAVTGPNQFIATNNKHRWFVNPGADNYHHDFYERPTAQTYQHAIVSSAVKGFSGPSVQVGNKHIAAAQYFEYIDIVRGHYGVDGNLLHFGIELFGVHKVSENGVRTSDFGESSHYNIRISNDPDGRGGLLLAAEGPKDLTGAWQTEKAFGYLDTNRSVGGPGGLFVTYETTGLNGYEDKIISDGKLEGTNQFVLHNRRVTSSSGLPMVEFRLNLDAVNTKHPSHALDLTQPLYIVFEATRGLKGNSNYLWNDKYNFEQAGNPYATVGLGNIYELDTLPGVINPPTKKTCPGDFNFDGTVDALDLLFFLTQWGPCPQGQECAADFNGDGVVDIRDMLIFLSKVWGPC